MSETDLVGYYDYEATHSLRRPLCLVGFMGARVDRLAYNIACMSGLRFASLRETVEHDAGRSIGQLVVEEGEAALRQRESEALERMLADEPAGIIALTDGSLLSGANVERILEAADLVYIEYSIDELASRVARTLTEKRAHFFPWIAPEGFSVTQLETLFEMRRAGYERAPHRIPGGEHSTTSLTDTLLEEFAVPS